MFTRWTEPWPPSVFLISEIAHGVRAGGLKERERRALSRRFGVSQELISQYERARSAYNALSDAWWRQAGKEARCGWGERDDDDPQKLADATEVILDRIKDEQRENPICRELDEAAAALRAVVDVPKKSELN